MEYKFKVFQSPGLAMSFGTRMFLEIGSKYISFSPQFWGCPLGQKVPYNTKVVAFQSPVLGMSFGTCFRGNTKNDSSFSPQTWGCPLGLFL